MDLMPIVPPIKEKGVWWGERDKRHAIIFWLVLTLGQAGQLISTEFSKPSWKNFDVLTTVFFFFWKRKKEKEKGKREEKLYVCLSIFTSLEEGVQRCILNFTISYSPGVELQDRGVDVHFLRLSMLHFKREMFKIILKISTINSVFPGGSMVKNLPASTGNSRFNPWVRKIPWRRKWQPTAIFLPGKAHGQRSLAGYSPWGRKELNTT